MDTVVLKGQFTLGWGVSELRAAGGSARFRVEWTADSGLISALREAGFDAAWTPGYGTAAVRVEGTVLPSPNGSEDIFLVRVVREIGPATISDAPPR
ncbi:MAG: hypothetical protein AB7J35_12895 [Dehalococcoidia bacterium]